jgi:hypothetical protein
MSANDDGGPWRSRYGPQQLRDVLGLTEWQHARATAAGTVPRADAAGGKWAGETVRELYKRRVAILRNAGSVPDLGAERAAEYLTKKLDVEVYSEALPELARQGRIVIVGDYKGWPLFCGRTLETLGADAIPEIEAANVAGELLTADRCADRLGIRASDFRHLVNLGWITPSGHGRGPYTPKSRPPDVPLYRAGDITALLLDESICWEAVRSAQRGQRSPLAALPPRGPVPSTT